MDRQEQSKFDCPKCACLYLVLAMIAPAQNAPPPDSTTLVIKDKYQQLLEQGPTRTHLVKQYELNALAQTLLQQLMKALSSNEPVDANQYMPLFLGKLESTLASTDPILILSREFGPQIEKLDLQESIGRVCKNVHYSADKFKDMQLREVADKKAFDSMTAFYDVKSMKTHRKLCLAVKNYTKVRKVFMESVQNGGDSFPQHCQAHQEYLKLMTEEMNINKLTLLPAQAMEEEGGQHTPQKIKPKKKADTAQTHKNSDEHAMVNQENPKVGWFIAPSQIANHSKRIRRSKEEIQKEREEKQKEREAKLKEKEAKQREKEEKQREKEQKQRQREQKKIEEENRRKEKQRERMEKEAEKKQKEEQKARQKEAREKEKQVERLAKEAQRLAKEKKKQPGASLFNWVKKVQSSPSKQDRLQSSSDMRCEKEESKDTIMELLKAQSTPIDQCRSQLPSGKMREQSRRFEVYFANIVMRKSRLEFTNFMVSEQRFQHYTDPFDEAEEGKYEESSIEYEDLCGQFCNENEADAMSEEEEEEASANSAIVPDSYKSEDQMSSEESGGRAVQVNINRGSEWAFSADCHPRAIDFAIICLEDAYPLPVSDPEPSTELNNALKCQLYLEIHGHFGVKQPLMRKLTSIAEKVPKSALDSLLKETTTKRGNQRLVRPQIIEYLNDVQEGFAAELEVVRARREEEWNEQMRDKVSEKEKQIEALILSGGTYVLMDIIQLLKEKGFRMTKKELLQFIESRTGQVWEQVGQRIKRRAPRQTSTMNKYLKPNSQADPTLTASCVEPAPNDNQIVPEQPQKQ